ncbi:MAG: DUF4965 domain-containing protein [Mediterranea sp.]|jgi:hypothetical protein|nr:DUF4965 domain-containing protein [Mediterranea sp.]
MEIGRTTRLLLPLLLLAVLCACQRPRENFRPCTLHTTERALTPFDKLPRLSGYALVKGQIYRFLGEADSAHADALVAPLDTLYEHATQTYYRYRCGDALLSLDFACPSLLKDKEMATVPIAFLTWRAATNDNRPVGVRLQWLYDGRQLTPEESTLLIAYDRLDTVQYMGENLLPAWTDGGRQTLADRLAYVSAHIDGLRTACDRMDSVYAGRTGLRAFASAHHFVAATDGRLFCFNDTLGCVRSASRNFPVLAAFGRPDWMRALLDPIFRYAEDPFWTKAYPPYDIGFYPIAARQWWLGEDFGPELSADMLGMTAALCQAENSDDYARAHWRMLARWAQVLKRDE